MHNTSMLDRRGGGDWWFGGCSSDRGPFRRRKNDNRAVGAFSVYVLYCAWHVRLDSGILTNSSKAWLRYKTKEKSRPGKITEKFNLRVKSR